MFKGHILLTLQFVFLALDIYILHPIDCAPVYHSYDCVVCVAVFPAAYDLPVARVVAGLICCHTKGHNQ